RTRTNVGATVRASCSETETLEIASASPRSVRSYEMLWPPVDASTILARCAASASTRASGSDLTGRRHMQESEAEHLERERDGAGVLGPADAAEPARLLRTCIRVWNEALWVD